MYPAYNLSLSPARFVARGLVSRTILTISPRRFFLALWSSSLRLPLFIWSRSNVPYLTLLPAPSVSSKLAVRIASNSAGEIFFGSFRLNFSTVSFAAASADAPDDPVFPGASALSAVRASDEMFVPPSTGAKEPGVDRALSCRAAVRTRRRGLRWPPGGRPLPSVGRDHRARRGATGPDMVATVNYHSRGSL